MGQAASFEKMTLKPFYNVASDVSVDGRWLAIGAGSDPDDYDAGGPLLLWDVARRVVHSRRTIAPGGISLEGDGLLRFSPSGRYVLVQFDTNRVMTIDLADLRELGSVGFSYGDSSPGVALLADESALLTTGEHGLAIAPIRGTYDVDSPAVRWLGSIEFPLLRVAVREDMVVGADRRFVCALDVTAGTLRYTSTALAGGYDSAYGISPGATIVAGADLGWVGFVDAATGNALARYEGVRARASSIVWDARGSRVAVVRDTWPGRRDSGDVAIFEGQAPLCRLPIRPRNRPWLMAPDLRSFAFSPDGTRAVVASSAGEVVGVEVSAHPRTVYRTALVDAQNGEDEGEWLGVYWCAGDQVIAITSREIIFLDGASGGVHARHELGFPAKRDVGMQGS